MTAEQFAYWLQGFAELTSEAPTAEQWQSMREHLATVFDKVTPPLQDRALFDVSEALRDRPVSPDIMTRKLC